MASKTQRSAPARNTPPPEPAGDGGPLEAASFIAETVQELAAVARRHRLDTLGYLLDMAQLEADELVRAGMVGGRP
jgi:hypothetical protein